MIGCLVWSDCWGNSSTAMGKQRAADGHPEPYRVRFFALGNEGSDGSITKDGKAHSLNDYAAKFAYSRTRVPTLSPKMLTGCLAKSFRK